MKTKWLFIKMCWKVLTNKEQGWIFFKLNEQQQKSLINGGNTTYTKFRYLGVDKKVVELLVKRFEGKED